MQSIKSAKFTFRGSFLFYFLVAFEFFYMASPFAVYFYSVYKPALNFFNQSPLLSWLIQFFLPHAVRETSSSLVNAHNIIGGILALLGFIGFLVGAVHVYYYKLAKKGVVTGGIYNHIRHPQYASFIICSFGLLILWPRYIVLIMFITMLFVYYMLARAEERECEAKFGSSYSEYRNRTGMFLPFRIPFSMNIRQRTATRRSRFILPLLTYLAALLIGILLASAVQKLTINSLYAVYSSDSATISINTTDTAILDQVLETALSDERVQTRIQQDHPAKLLNYVLPTTWFAAEIPMNGVKYRAGHKSPADYDHNLYKIIFTKATMRSGENVEGKDILTQVSERKGIVEVWVDLAKGKVTQILELPESVKYGNIPVAVY